MAERWRLDNGYLVGFPVGTLVTLEPDGDEIRLSRPYVGLLLRLPASTTQQVGSVDHLRLINPDESIDLSLTRVEVPDDLVEALNSPSAPPRARVSAHAIRRFVLGAFVVGAVASLLLTATVVGMISRSDRRTPSDTDRNIARPKHVPCSQCPAAWAGARRFGVGWRLRGFGIMGAALGAAVGGYLGFAGGDQVALLLNAQSSPLSEVGGEGMATFVVGAVWIFMIPAVVVIGLVGAAIGALVRRLRRTPAEAAG